MRRFSIRELELRFPRWLIILLTSTFVFFQSATQTGFIPSTIGVLQDSFNLTSSETGSLVSGYDFASMLLAAPIGYLCVPLAPRFLGIGMAVMAISIITFTFANLLPVGPDSSGGAYAVLMLSQILFGFGSSPLYVIVPVYYAANMGRSFLSLALGLFYATAAFGPAVGFILGGLAVSMWKWWAAMLLLGFSAFVFSFFLFLCPLDFHRPGEVILGDDDVEMENTRREEDDDSDTGSQVALEDALDDFGSSAVGSGGSIADRIVKKRPGRKSETSVEYQKPRFVVCLTSNAWNAVMVTLREPTFMVNNLAIATQTFVVSSLTTFFPLFLSMTFNLDEGLAAIFMGITVVPGAAGGIILGGYIMKRLDASMSQHIKMTYITTFMAGVFSFIFYLENHIVFLVLLAPMMALVFISSVSCNTIAMRVVPPVHRGIAVGIQSITFRLLGSVPGPLIMGGLFDAACIEWDGACLLYDIPRLRLTWLIFCVVCCMITGILFSLQEITWGRRTRREKELRARVTQHSARTGDEL